MSILSENDLFTSSNPLRRNTSYYLMVLVMNGQINNVIEKHGAFRKHCHNKEEIIDFHIRTGRRSNFTNEISAICEHKLINS